MLSGSISPRDLDSERQFLQVPELGQSRNKNRLYSSEIEAGEQEIFSYRFVTVYLRLKSALTASPPFTVVLVVKDFAA